MPGPASKLYAQNIVNLVTLMTGKDSDGNPAFAPDFDDEIVSGSCVTRDGAIVHEPTREAIEGPAEQAADEQPVAEPEPASDDNGAADDDGMPPEGPVDEQLDLPYDQEADQ
jgi:NAD(P) transhydrogenase subunit alpha